MIITSRAIKEITTRAKNRLALEFDRSVHTIERWIDDNDDNGPLTTAGAIKIIAEETGMQPDEILKNPTVPQ